jgi:hypothetical protein
MIRPARLVALPVILAVLAGWLAGAGQPPEKKDDKKDPFAGFEPRSKPGAGQKFLEKFVGEWEVVKAFHPRAGDPVRVKGECRQTLIHDGRFLQSEFTFQTDSGKTTGLGLIGFEPDSGLFTSVWTDSRQTRMSIRRSEEKFNGEEITLVGKELDGKDGRRTRTVTRLEDDGKKIVHRQYVIAADGKDRLVMELVLTKKPGGK